MKAIEVLFTFMVGLAVGIASYGSYKSHDYHITTQNPEPIREYIYIESEPEIIEKVVEVEKVVYLSSEEFFRNLTEEDEWYLKDLAMREAEGEGVIGQCWVMYTVLCRCEAFNHTIKDEWSSSAYTSMNRTGLTPNEDCLMAFELIREGWTPKPLYFRARGYHSFGTELCQVGNHYFSY